MWAGGEAHEAMPADGVCGARAKNACRPCVTRMELLRGCISVKQQKCTEV